MVGFLFWFSGSAMNQTFSKRGASAAASDGSLTMSLSRMG
jgi:hypothetical protein